MKSTKKTYGEAQKKHAVNLRLISRFSYAEIETETGIPEAYVRKLVHEENAKEVTLSVTGNAIEVTDAPNAVTQSVTAVTDAKMPEKPAENATETPFLKVADEKTGTGKGFFARHFSRMDCVFYVATVTACYSFWHVSPGVPGATFAALYWLLAFDALQRCKAAAENMALAKSAETRVWGLEMFAAVAHWNLINGYLWRNLDKLPFEVKAIPKGGMWILDYAGEKTNVIWHNGAGVAIVAAVLSVSICAAVIVAVGTTFQASKSLKK